MSGTKKIQTNEDLLQMVCDTMKFDSVEDMLDNATFDYDNMCPGICTNCDSVVEDCEPDSRIGHCNECNKNTIVSVLVLADLI